MALIICPGIHPPHHTQSLLRQIVCPNAIVFPTDRQPAYSPLHLLEFVQSRCLPTEPLLLLAFSAGVVGAIGLARRWQKLGRPIHSLIAVDGWGVPLEGGFPIHRLSHDWFTDWSSAWGKSETHFYADPPVEHLALWHSPELALGYQQAPNTAPQRTTAAQVLQILIDRYSKQT